MKALSIRLRRVRRLNRVPLALAVAAIAAPAAGAATDPYAAIPQGAIQGKAPDVSSAPVRGEDKSGLVSPEARALQLRSEALNRKYAEQRALMLRSEALNRQYGVGSSGAILTHDDKVIPDINVVPVSVSEPDSGFNWSDAGIGAAGMFGLALVAAGVLFAFRHRRDRGEFAAAH